MIKDENRREIQMQTNVLQGKSLYKAIYFITEYIY